MGGGVLRERSKGWKFSQPFKETYEGRCEMKTEEMDNERRKQNQLGSNCAYSISYKLVPPKLQ